MSERLLLDRAAVLQLAMGASDSEYVCPLDEICSRYDKILFESVEMSEIIRALWRRPSLGSKLLALPRQRLQLSTQLEAELEEFAKIALTKPEVIAALYACTPSVTRSQDELLGYVIRLLLLATKFDADILPSARRTNLLLALFREANVSFKVVRNGQLRIAETEDGGLPVFDGNISASGNGRSVRVVLAEKHIESRLLPPEEYVPVPTAQGTSGEWLERLPDQNNVWYGDRESDTVLVMIHGILSNSRNCWLATDEHDQPICYWPELIYSDRRLNRISVFLGGYYAAFDSGVAEIRNCADELYRSITRPAVSGRKSVWQHENLIFLGHSTGGIVARYLIEEHKEELKSKNVGVVLIASPSYGSHYANVLKGAAHIFKNKLAQQLQIGSWSLRDLDARFKNLVSERTIPNLWGIEAYEHHFIVHRTYLPPTSQVVTEESAGRYFGSPVLLSGTDHFSAVKPTHGDHPAHALLVDFVTGKYKQVAMRSF